MGTCSSDSSQPAQGQCYCGTFSFFACQSPSRLQDASGQNCCSETVRCYFIQFCSYLYCRIHIHRLFCDKSPPGWLAWTETLDLYLPPHASSSTFQPWQETSQSAVQCVRKIVTEEHFWKELSTHYAEENHRTSVSQDNMSFVKTICRRNHV